MSFFFSLHAGSENANEQLKELHMLMKEDLTPVDRVHVRKSIEQHKLGTNRTLLRQVRRPGLSSALSSQKLFGSSSSGRWGIFPVKGTVGHDSLAFTEVGFVQLTVAESPFLFLPTYLFLVLKRKVKRWGYSPGKLSET